MKQSILLTIAQCLVVRTLFALRPPVYGASRLIIAFYLTTTFAYIPYTLFHSASNWFPRRRRPNKETLWLAWVD